MNHLKNLFVPMHVLQAPVSYSQLLVISFTVTSTLGHLLSQYQFDKIEGIKFTVAIDIAQMKKITFAMPNEILMRGFIMPFREKLNQPPHFHYHNHLNLAHFLGSTIHHLA